MDNFDPAVVVTTAPTTRQVRHILWKEMHSAYAKAERNGRGLGGNLLTQLWKYGEEKFAIGFATREYSADLFQGIHSANLLVVVDEASGITEQVWEGIMSILKGGNARLLAIGNPTSSSGTFYEAFQPDKTGLWHTKNISAFDSPNVRAGRVVVPGLITLEDIEDARKDWGEGSFLWESKILGRFPDTTIDTLIPLSDVELAADEDFECIGPVEVGADIGWYGDDATVFIARAGACAFDSKAYSRQGTMETTGCLVDFLRQHQAVSVKIDSVGYGAGVYDRMKELQDDGDLPSWLNIVPMNGGSAPRDRERYADASSEWWGELAKRLANREIGGPVFGVKKLQSELISRKKSYTSKGQIKLEPKDALRRRGLKSPDWADAMVMAFSDVRAQVDDPAAEVLRGLRLY